MPELSSLTSNANGLSLLIDASPWGVSGISQEQDCDPGSVVWFDKTAKIMANEVNAVMAGARKYFASITVASEHLSIFGGKFLDLLPGDRLISESLRFGSISGDFKFTAGMILGSCAKSGSPGRLSKTYHRDGKLFINGANEVGEITMSWLVAAELGIPIIFAASSHEAVIELRRNLALAPFNPPVIATKMSAKDRIGYASKPQISCCRQISSAVELACSRFIKGMPKLRMPKPKFLRVDYSTAFSGVSVIDGGSFVTAANKIALSLGRSALQQAA